MVETSIINKEKDLKICFYIKFKIILIECLFSKKKEFNADLFYKTVPTIKTNLQNKINDYITSANENQDHYFKSILIKSLCLIGKNLEQISWNFNDRECIRNKHAELNRYSDKKTQNPIGAKLNFETLAYLIHLNEDLNEDKVKAILDSSQNLACLREDLLKLLAKLDFITLNEDQFDMKDLKEVQKNLIDNYSIEINSENLMRKKSVDVMPEFLTSIAWFCHDRMCSNNIIQLISLYKTEANDAIRNSNQMLHIYFIASILFQIGQSAHEYSNFILVDSLKVLFKANLYKIFRSDIYFYSHKLKHKLFLNEYIDLFETVNTDLEKLIQIIFQFLASHENFKKFYELCQDTQVKDLTNSINLKLDNFIEKNRTKPQCSNEKEARVDSDERKVQIRATNTFNNIKEEYLNFSNFINIDDNSIYKPHAIKFSICLIGNYFRNSNELVTILKKTEYKNIDNLFLMINDILKTRHMNARDVCNENNTFLVERFQFYFNQFYKINLDDFVKNYESIFSNSY